MNGTTHPWTADDDAYLRDNYLTQQHKEIAATLGKTPNAVRNRCHRLGLQKKILRHGEDVRGAIREFYEAHAGKPMDQASFADRLGLSRTTVAKIAREMGLTDKHRAPTAEAMRKTAQKVAFYWQMGLHPRGMLGKKHSLETRRRLTVIVNDRVAAMTVEQRGAHIAKGLKTKAKRGNLVNPRPKTTWKQGWHTIGGKRHFFRSKWEVNYACYLEWLKSRGEIAEWEYEPTTFWFEAIKRGVRSYTPDFRVTEKNGNVAYHEVKGWMDDRSATKLKRMKKYHPDVRVVLLDAASYKTLNRQVLGLVPGWC